MASLKWVYKALDIAEGELLILGPFSLYTQHTSTHLLMALGHSLTSVILQSGHFYRVSSLALSSVLSSYKV